MKGQGRGESLAEPVVRGRDTGRGQGPLKAERPRTRHEASAGSMGGMLEVAGGGSRRQRRRGGSGAVFVIGGSSPGGEMGGVCSVIAMR